MEKKKTIDEIIKSGNANINFNAKAPEPKKRSILGRVISWPFRFALAMFGLDMKDVKKSNTKHGNHYTQGNIHHSDRSAEFRESHKVSHSPFSAYGFNPVEAENLAIYLKSSDGRGDPDCEHEH